MFTPPRLRARALPAGAASASNSAIWRRYPKRDGKGRVEWIHWADLDLAAAWAEQALAQLDAFVAKYSGATASAAQLEGGARAPITMEAFAVLRSLNHAFQALNVPPIVAPESEEFGAVDLIRSFVVLSGGRVEVRTQLMISGGRRSPLPAAEMAALWRLLGARELASDEGIVVDVRTQQVVFRGAFEATFAFKRKASDGDRAFFALWARRPWTLIRAEGEDELVWGAPLVWERDRIGRKLELARPTMAAIGRDPWSALVSARERVKAHNDALAIEWAGQMPELSSANSSDQVQRVQASMRALAQARSEAALAQARAAAREGLATGAGSVAGVLGVISAAAPPAALVLAPAAAVLGAVAALAGLMLQVIPREWLATAEVVPPRLPLPYMTTGDEGPSDPPSHAVNRPSESRPVARPVAPTPLDAPPVDVVQTMTASPTTTRSSTTTLPLQRRSSTITALLAANASSPHAPSSAEIDRERAPPQRQENPRLERLASTAPTSLRVQSNASRTAVVAVSAGAGLALLWMLSNQR